MEKAEKHKSRHASGVSTGSSDSYSNYIPTPPDGGYGWVVVMAAFFIHVIVDGVIFTFGLFYVDFLEEFGEGKGKTSLVGSLLSGFYLLMCFIASALVNKFGCRPVSIAGGLLSSLSFFLTIFSPNLNMLMITYGVMGGSGFALVFFPSVISVSCYFQRRRALATGIAVCGAGAGGFIMAPFVRFLLDIYDWKNTMLIISGVCLNSCVFAALLRPLPTPKKKKSMPRTKNLIDRLKEIARRSRMESECSVCERAKGNRMSMKQRLEEVKLARERRLKEDDSEFDFDSITGQALMGRNAPTSNITAASPESDTKAPYGSLPLTDLPKERSPIRNGEVFRRIRSISEPPIACFQKGTSQGEPSFSFPPVIPEEMEEKFQSSSTLNINESEDNGSSLENVTDYSEKSPLDPRYLENLTTSPDSHAPIKTTTKDSVLSDEANTRITWKAFRSSTRIQRVDLSRPLYRKDIFYSGSSFNLRAPSSLDARTYAMSMLSIPGEVSPAKETCLCRAIPKAAKDTLKEMMDFSLFKERVFVIILVGNLLGFTALFIPYVYISDRAIKLGVAHNDAAMLLSIIGFANMLGRLLSGFLADLKCTNVLALHNGSLLVSGVACFLNMFAVNFPLMCLYAAVFGLCIAAYVSLTSVVLCDMLGIERLTNAYGLLCTFRGLAAIIGAPLAGAVLDITGDMDVAFHVGGFLLLVSGIVFSLLHLPHFRKSRPGNSHCDVTTPDNTVTFSDIVHESMRRESKD